MSTFHVWVMRGGWAITMLVREKDSRKKTEDIVYYISLVINFIFSSVRSSNFIPVAVNVHLREIVKRIYEKVLRASMARDLLQWHWDSVDIMVLTDCHNDYPQAKTGTK